MNDRHYQPTEVQSGSPLSAIAADHSETLTLSASAVPPRTDATPITVPADGPPNLGHYELGRELGRGGMGKVFLGRDLRLNRDVAIKILHQRYGHDSTIRQRFLDEAQITGQLQNPGVPPIHELGQLTDGRPFLVMKLVKGQTLAADLADWKLASLSRAEIVSRALPVLEKVAQTMAFAHSKGVLHRDLKPANIMVGAFGEVQVMDWGVAKLLGTAAVPPVTVPAVGTSLPSIVSTDRDPDSETQAGTVMGTPSYMAPEQARGEVDRLTPAVDVFALGAILTEILTGHGVYGGTLIEIRAKAELGLTGDALARLDSAEAPPELTSLAKRCLAPLAVDRPQDAGEVAKALADYRDSVGEKLRQAELARAEARAQSAERRRKRQVQWALFLALLVLLAVLLGGWRWWQLQQESQRVSQAERAAATSRDVALVLSEIDTLLEQAAMLSGDPPRWEGTLARADSALRRGEAAVRQGGTSGALEQQLAMRKRALVKAQNDRRLVLRLDEITFRHLDQGDLGGSMAGTAADITAALKDNGMPLAATDAAEASVQWVRTHPHQFVVLEALFDLWYHETRPEAKERVLGILRLAMAEISPFTKEWMLALDRRDGSALARLAAALPDQDLSPWVAHRLFCHLWELGWGNEGIAFIKRGIARYPGDYRLHSRLGQSLIYLNTLANDQQAARELAAAAALRPDSFNVLCCLARIHWRTRDREAAQACLGRARQMLGSAGTQDFYLGAYVHLGFALRQFGDNVAALEIFELADRRFPGSAMVTSQRAWTLIQLQRYEEAVNLAVRSTEMEPNNAGFFNTLGVAYMQWGKPKEAEAALRRAIELSPNLAYTYGNLAMLLTDRGRFDEALPLFERSLALNPHDWVVARKFIQVLLEKRQMSRAAELLQRATEQRPDDPAFTIARGRLLLKQQKFADAEIELRRSLTHYPKSGEVHNLLSIAVGYQGRIDEAVKLLRQAVELEPNNAHAQMNLGGWLVWQGNFTEAAQRIARARQLNPNVKSDTPEKKPKAK